MSDESQAGLSSGHKCLDGAGEGHWLRVCVVGQWWDGVLLQEGLVWSQCPTCIKGGNSMVPVRFFMGGAGGEEGGLVITGVSR